VSVGEVQEFSKLGAMTSDEQHQRARLNATMSNIRIDAATGEVVAALRLRGIESVVLKGPALSAWYSSDSVRTYVDGDVWVAPGEVHAAEAVLRTLGFAPTQDESGLPGWWEEHGSSWFRATDGGKIDLHRRLQGTALDPAKTWELLWGRSVEILVGGVPARRLDDAALALYLTVHATHHGVQDSRGLPHLRAALSAVDDSVWLGALELAECLEALDGFSTGLRLIPEGASLAARLNIPDVRSVKAALHAASPPPVALGFEQLASGSGLARIEILFRKLVPPPGFVRHWWPPAAANRRMLLVGYLYRPIWLLQHAPAGYRAWRAAQHQVESQTRSESSSR
jgi:hypothetical protein